ncbi:hypothetical protein M0M57_05125 [Flavobacterium azooxidireducens]|uniref:Uncharacterized protein n=1 Tax=Flavobacterium azooxidireducens TaxID=1871076 RepID=A0ABY4KKB7_9FLAO|nr:hypothetical protein [Flavobacterium azooxidireducens]UPQ80218.1 hypothetical protein M0M57_05125 [Flavobacterium azooxidireducens]
MDSEDIYKSCVIDRTQQKLIEGYGVKKDIFKLLEEAELSLVESKVIQNTSKESYLKLMELTFNNEEISKKITASIKTNVGGNFFDLLSLTTLDFYSYCPEEVYSKEADDVNKTILRGRFTIYANLMADGYKNEIRIASLINESEKFSETERLVILHLILMNVPN